MDLDHKGSARAAGLRYVSDAMPGIRRKKAGKGFRYVDATGVIIRDLAVLERIKALAIPPAWRKVWICSKDFRTWAGTVLALRSLQDLGRFASKNQAKRNVTLAIAAVASVLSNTKTVCRKCYVHPEIIKAYLEGTLGAAMDKSKPAGAPKWLYPEEIAALNLLEQASRPDKVYSSA